MTSRDVDYFGSMNGVQAELEFVEARNKPCLLNRKHERHKHVSVAQATNEACKVSPKIKMEKSILASPWCKTSKISEITEMVFSGCATRPPAGNGRWPAETVRDSQFHLTSDQW